MMLWFNEWSIESLAYLNLTDKGNFPYYQYMDAKISYATCSLNVIIWTKETNLWIEDYKKLHKYVFFHFDPFTGIWR